MSSDDRAFPPAWPRHSASPILSSAGSSVQIVDSSFNNIAGDYHHHGHVHVFNAPVSVHDPQSAFPRPSLLNLVSMGAAYNSQERDPAPRCHPETRKEILEKINAWVTAGAEGTSILWLHGPAGAGKSAIAQTVAETCAGRNQLAATFFFARTVARRNAVRFLFPTMALQIALSSPEKRQKLDNIFKHDPYISERAMGSIELIASLYGDCQYPIPSSPFLVVIDGLDECHGHDDQCLILKQVSHIIHTYRLPLRFLIVSRPESHLLEAFEEPALVNVANRLSLYGDFRAYNDVFIYLRNEFSRIYESKRHKDIMEFVPRPWPSDDAIQRIVRKSGGYFIYASTVIRFTDEEYFEPPERLDQVLNHSISSTVPDSTPFAELDKLYIQILSSCPKPQIPFLKCILGYAVFNFNPRGIGHIASFLHLSPGKVKLALRGLRSIVSFEGTREPLKLMHASFGDFLADGARAGTYHIDSGEWHHAQFCNSLSLGIKSTHLLSDLAFPISSSQPLLKEIWTSMGSGLRDFFRYSSGKDRLAAFIQESVEKSLWYSRLEDPDWSPGEDMLVLVDLFTLMAEILSPKDKVCLPFTVSSLNSSESIVAQHDSVFTPATQLRVEDFVRRLSNLCDSALLKYISKLADTPAKRDHLYIIYAAVDEDDVRHFGFNHEAVKDVPTYLDLHAPDFPLAWEDLRKFLVIKLGLFLPRYLENLLSDPGRSDAFHCDRNRWAAFVAARSLRYLRTTR